jgi:hypothetical protein
MHTVHLPENGPVNGIRYSAMGIIFSVNDYTVAATPEEIKVIDNFFDSLKWEIDNENPLVDHISYG